MTLNFNSLITIIASEYKSLGGHQWNIPVESNLRGSSPGATLESLGVATEPSLSRGGNVPLLGLVGLEHGGEKD